MKATGLCGLVIAVGVAVVPAIAQDSYRIEPTESSILGFPLTELDRKWKAASLVTESNLPRLAKEDLAYVTDPYAFSLDGDFNGDGHPDRVVVGVYRARGGEEGQFLLIVTQRTPGGWSVSTVSKLAGRPGPSVLFRAPDSLNWVPCTACDVFAVVSWKRGRYRTEWAETDVE